MTGISVPVPNRVKDEDSAGISTGTESETPNCGLNLDLETDELESDEKVDDPMQELEASGGQDMEQPIISPFPVEEEAFFGGFSLEQLTKFPSLFGEYPNTGFHSVFYACQNNPLGIWEKQTRSGVIKRIVDDDGTACLKLIDHGKYKETQTSTSITAPCAPFRSLGIQLPYMLMTVKGLNMDFAFRIMILDSSQSRRSILFTTRFTMFKKTVYDAVIPLRLEVGWNQLSFDLNLYVRTIFRTYCKEIIRIQIFPNCRIRMINFVSTPINIHHEVTILREILAERERNFQMDPPFSFQFDGYEPHFVATKVVIPENLRDYISRASIRRQADALQVQEKKRVPLSQPKRIYCNATRSREDFHGPRGSSSNRNLPYMSWREAYAKKSTEVIQSQSRAKLVRKLRLVTEDAVQRSILAAAIKVEKKRKKANNDKKKDISDVDSTTTGSESSVQVAPSNNNNLPTVLDSNGKPKQLKAYLIESQTYLVQESSGNSSCRESVIRILSTGSSSTDHRPATTMSACELRNDPRASSDICLNLDANYDHDRSEMRACVTKAEQAALLNALKTWDPVSIQHPQLGNLGSARHSDSLLNGESTSIAPQEVRAEFLLEAARLNKSSLTTDQVNDQLKIKLSALLTDTKAKAGRYASSQDSEAEASGGSTTEPGVETLAVPRGKRIRWENPLPSQTIRKKKVVVKRSEPKKLGGPVAMSSNRKVKTKLLDRVGTESTRAVPGSTNKDILNRIGVRTINTLLSDIREASTVIRNSEVNRAEAQSELKKIQALMHERVRLLEDATTRTDREFSASSGTTDSASNKRSEDWHTKPGPSSTRNGN